MKEKVIKDKVYKELEKDGWWGWSAPKVKYQETDIWGIFDGQFLKDSDIRFIQWTTASNMSARKKKILKVFKERNVWLPCEIWGLRDNGTFKIEYL